MEDWGLLGDAAPRRQVLFLLLLLTKTVSFPPIPGHHSSGGSPPLPPRGKCLFCTVSMKYTVQKTRGFAWGPHWASHEKRTENNIVSLKKNAARQLSDTQHHCENGHTKRNAVTVSYFYFVFFLLPSHHETDFTWLIFATFLRRQKMFNRYINLQTQLSGRDRSCNHIWRSHEWSRRADERESRIIERRRW